MQKLSQESLCFLTSSHNLLYYPTEKRVLMKVLLVDDDTTQLRKYRNIISDLGHEVEAISESVVAWNLLDSEKFDAIVSDVQMPLFSGVELMWAVHYLNLDLPCLLHSSEARHPAGLAWEELDKLHEELPFVTFRLKRFDIEPSYIKEFLDSISK